MFLNSLMPLGIGWNQQPLKPSAQKQDKIPLVSREEVKDTVHFGVAIHLSHIDYTVGSHAIGHVGGGGSGGGGTRMGESGQRTYEREY
jgi:hypothetical protein